MPKHFLCCLSLKVGAIIMAFVNLLGGSAGIVGGIVEVSQSKSEGTTTLFVVCLLIGLLSIFHGLLLIFGIIQAKEKYIFLYLLTGSACLFIVTIYSGINMFEHKILVPLFFSTVFLWYGQFCMYSFYEEVSEYNTVNAGVIEIAYTGNGYVNAGLTKTGSFENTAV